MSRAEAVARLGAQGEDTPQDAIDRFCAYVGIPVARFFEIADQFRNRDIWHQRPDGVWQLNGFLIDGWTWS